MKTLLFVSLLSLISFSAFPGEKGGNDGGELEALLEQYQITNVCPVIPKNYCQDVLPAEVDYADIEMQDFLRKCCSR